MVPVLLENVSRLGVEVDQGLTPMALAEAAMVIGLAYRLSSYGGCYLELAARRGLSLATENTQLLRASSSAGVGILKA